jgi:ribonucleoside-triphosphate reductase
MDWYFPLNDLPIEMPSDIEETEEIKEFCMSYIVDYIMEIQKIFIELFDKGDPMLGNAPFRFPVVTINFSKKKWGDKTVVVDNKLLKYITKKDIYRYNIFVSEGTKTASCCRLISDSEMLELAASSNSFGGSAISLGSHRVITINFNRIALEAKTKEEFYSILDQRILDAGKILKAHKELIINFKDKGLQPFISLGWINMNRMFSTFGMLGIYEGSITYKDKFKASGDVTKDILEYFNKKVGEVGKELKIICNIEQIPAESFASRLAKTDRMIYGDDKVPYVIYANQFVPLWEEATMWEKMDVDGKYNQLITGGGIVHCTIGEKVTGAQAEKIIKYSVNSGCEHFALNSIYSRCENNHTHFGDLETCPVCEAKIIEKYTRVVGFMTPVSSWGKERRTWEFPKRHKVVFEENKI